jgi:hypothetical protein
MMLIMMYLFLAYGIIVVITIIVKTYFRGGSLPQQNPNVTPRQEFR